MNQSYIFRPPARSRDLPFTFEKLSEYVGRGYNYTDGSPSRKLGTTLNFIVHRADRSRVPWVRVTLYGVNIAWIYQEMVTISEDINDYPRQATTHWVQKILTDNNIPGLVGRLDNEYAVAGKRFDL